MSDSCSPCLCIFSNHNESLLLFPSSMWIVSTTLPCLLKKSRKKERFHLQFLHFLFFVSAEKRVAEASRNENEVNSNGFPSSPSPFMNGKILSFFLCFPLPLPLTLRINQYFSCVSRVDNKYNRTNRHNIPSRRSLSTSLALQNRTGLEWLALNLVMYTHFSPLVVNGENEVITWIRDTGKR